jgi:hypothetical protein
MTQPRYFRASNRRLGYRQFLRLLEQGVTHFRVPAHTDGSEYMVVVKGEWLYVVFVPPLKVKFLSTRLKLPSFRRWYDSGDGPTARDHLYEVLKGIPWRPYTPDKVTKFLGWDGEVPTEAADAQPAIKSE